MNDDNKKLLKKMKDFGDNMTPEKARTFLVRAGLCDENGRLTEPYLVQPENLLGSKGQRSISDVKGLLKILVGKAEARIIDEKVLRKLKTQDIYEQYSYKCPEHLAKETEHYNLLRQEVKDVMRQKGFSNYFKIV